MFEELDACLVKANTLAALKEWDSKHLFTFTEISEHEFHVKISDKHNIIVNIAPFVDTYATTILENVGIGQSEPRKIKDYEDLKKELMRVHKLK